MRTSHSVKWILAGALIMPGLTGCSFFGGGDDAEVASSEETTEAAPEGAEANTAQAEASDNPEAIAGAESNSLNDAAVASAAEAAAGPAGGGLPGSEIPPELLANGGTPSATDPTAGATAMGAAPGSAPASAGFSAPPSDVRVYYVTNSATLHNSPNASSQSVGALQKGDPVLVKVEGNWANVVNRGWVELASLSMGPVARAKPAKSWN